jgi:nitrate reductase NapE component
MQKKKLTLAYLISAAFSEYNGIKPNRCAINSSCNTLLLCNSVDKKTKITKNKNIKFSFFNYLVFVLISTISIAIVGIYNYL